MLSALGLAVYAQNGTTRNATSNTTAEHKVYTLRHKAAAEVERMLAQMLSELGQTTHLASDARANQILLRGPEEAQRIARQLIDSVDRPPVRSAAATTPVIRAYPCPRDRLSDLSNHLRRLYRVGDGIRVAVDTPTSRLFVLAPPNIHEEISRRLAELGGLATGGVLASTKPPSPKPRAETEPRERFVALIHSRVEKLEPMLRDLLSPRLRPVEDRMPGRPDFMLMGGSGQWVELSIDQRRNGIMLLGEPSLVEQLVRLIRCLDGPRPTGDRSVRVMPMRWTDPAKVRRAVRAYRSGTLEDDYRPRPMPSDAPGGMPGASIQPGAFRGGQSHFRGENICFESDVHRAAKIGTVPYERRSRFSPQGIDLVNYELVSTLLQPTPPEAPGGPGGGEGPAGPADEAEQEGRLRALGTDVQVEILPDLDVIILRGRERDVEEITRIIKELERLSAETEPRIEVYPLKHVAGPALVTIVEQVSPELIGGRQGRVSVTPLVKPNALLLIGWGEAVKTIKELIAKLDQPVEPQTQLRVFRLKHAPAAQARTTISQFFAGRSGLGPKLVVTADIRTNSLVVQAAARDMDEVAALIERIDTGTSAAVTRARIFKLKNSLAADLGGTLQAAIDAARGGRGSLAGKSAILELLGIDAQGERILRSGILSDVRITPDVRTNSLVISAPAESMALLAELIRQLDSPAVVAQIKVFQIVNGDANDMIRMLRSLLPTQTGAAARLELPVAEGETSLVPVRFSVDARTNSIIATGSKGDLAIIEALLLRLDDEDVQQRKNSVYRLKSSPAIDVARAINEFLRSERQVQRAAPGAESPFQQIEREVVVVPEPVSNALIISATPRFFDDILDLVEKLDAQPPQVMIQVLIAELKLGNTEEFGVELGLQDSVLFDRSMLGNLITTLATTEQSTADGVITSTTETIQAADNLPGFSFTNNPLGNSGSAKAIRDANVVGGQGVTTFAVGRVNNELGFGGLVLSASSESVSLLIRALQESRRLEVLSRPQIMTLDNQPAFIQVGQRVPRITGTTINATGQVNNIQMEDVGLILGVTPRISPDGTIVLELDAEKSEVGPEIEGIPVSISEGVVIRSPRVDITTAQTTVSARDGETIVLGGLIMKGSRTIKRRVPWLSDIPLLGQIFRYDSEIEKRTELLIIMTPHVIRTAEDAERIKHIEAARIHWCLGDVTRLHGDTGLFEISDEMPCDGRTEVIFPDMNPRGIVPDESAPMESQMRPEPKLIPQPEIVPTPPSSEKMSLPSAGDLKSSHGLDAISRAAIPVGVPPVRIAMPARSRQGAVVPAGHWPPSNPRPAYHQAQPIPTRLPNVPQGHSLVPTLRVGTQETDDRRQGNTRSVGTRA
jgi:type II secretion system protein D